MDSIHIIFLIILYFLFTYPLLIISEKYLDCVQIIFLQFLLKHSTHEKEKKRKQSQHDQESNFLNCVFIIFYYYLLKPSSLKKCIKQLQTNQLFILFFFSFYQNHHILKSIASKQIKIGLLRTYLDSVHIIFLQFLFKPPISCEVYRTTRPKLNR